MANKLLRGKDTEDNKESTPSYLYPQTSFFGLTLAAKGFIAASSIHYLGKPNHVHLLSHDHFCDLIRDDAVVSISIFRDNPAMMASTPPSGTNPGRYLHLLSTMYVYQLSQDFGFIIVAYGTTL